jgi:hypothetical protein
MRDVPLGACESPQPCRGRPDSCPLPAHAACTAAKAAGSSFKIALDEAASSVNKVCMRISIDAACDTNSPCCLGSLTQNKVKSITLALGAWRPQRRRRGLAAAEAAPACCKHTAWHGLSSSQMQDRAHALEGQVRISLLGAFVAFHFAPPGRVLPAYPQVLRARAAPRRSSSEGISTSLLAAVPRASRPHTI